MIKFKVKSVYNTPEVEKMDGFNLSREILVEWENHMDTFKIEIKETKTEFDEFHRLISEDTFEKTEYFEATGEWVLMLEKPDIYYAAFHALSVGYDGSHMSYMIINEAEILENN